MKNLKPIVIVCFMAFGLCRAEVSPLDAKGYVYQNDAAYNWVEINPGYGGSGQTANWSAHISGNYAYTNKIPLGFTFNYYGVNYDSIYIMSSGWLSFTAASNAGKPASRLFPDATDNFRGVIGPLVMTFTPGANTECYYQKQGTAPHRTFVVEWANAYSVFNQNNFSFEAVFDEYTGRILFQYSMLADNGTLSDPESSYIGIESPDQTAGLFYGAQVRYNTGSFPADESALLFGPAFRLATPRVDGAVAAACTIRWHALCANDTAAVSLYYDNGRDTTGTLITDELTLADSTGYVWTPWHLTPRDTIYLYGVMQNGAERTVSYAPGRIWFSSVGMAQTHAFNRPAVIPAGPTFYRIDGRVCAGRPMAGGVYIVRQGSRGLQKIMIVR
jgi:hypothetical protein